MSPQHPQQQMTIQQAIDLAIERQQAGALGEAESIYRQVLAVQPNHADALHLLGIVMAQSGRANGGIELIRRAILLNPSVLAYHCNLGQALLTSGKPAEAVQSFRAALALQPNDLDAALGLANALQATGQGQLAIATLRQAMAAHPGSVEVLNNLANALQAEGKLDEAGEIFARAIQQRPDLPELHNNFAVVLQERYKLDQAAEHLHRAISLRPSFADAYNNLGSVLKDQGKFDDAVSALHQAISLRPDFADAHNNLGIALRQLGQIDESIQSFRRALAINPNFAKAHFNLGVAHLLKGDYRNGWPEYEWRRQMPTLNPQRRAFAQPQWDGRDLAGRRILIYPEQGFGDTIQFVRYVPLVAQRGAEVILAAPPELVRLLQSVEGVSQIVSRDDAMPEFDVHCPLLSLPLIFGTDLNNLPNRVPYLQADQRLSAQWRQRIGRREGFLNVGIAWAGRSAPSPRRSIPLSVLQRLAQVENVSWFSLQKPDADTLLQMGSSLALGGFAITDSSTELTDFADTAALIDNLDLVITIDTAVAHLAGAMGKPTWVLLMHQADWRWLIGRPDSPWYPTMRLFRQPTAGDWRSAVEQIAKEISIRPGKL